MDGNLGTWAPADRAIRGRIKQIGGEGGGKLEHSGAAGGEGGGSGEAASMMVDSTSTEWTDEKHSLYLNSMEESFVNQLYNHGFGSNNPLGWMSRTQKDRNSLASHAENIYSGQFKVLRGGCWGEVKFERPRTRADIQNETRILSRNPWIQHFRSASNDKCVDSLSSEHLKSDDIANRATNTGRQSHVIADCGETGLNQQPACCTHLCHQYSVCCHTEVSDQNFVDDFEEAKRSRVCKKKRTRTTFSDARDQVVPFGKTTAISSADERISSLKGKNVECSSTKAAKFG